MKSIFPLLAVILILTTMVGCQSPQPLGVDRCLPVVKLPAVQQLLALPGGDGSQFLALSQPIEQLDPHREWMSDGAFWRIEPSADGGWRAYELDVRGRDELPLRPVAADTLRLEGESYLYVINSARHSHHTIELYRIDGDTLHWQHRWHTNLLREPHSIVVADRDRFYIANRRRLSLLSTYGGRALLLGGGAITYHNNGFFHYRDVPLVRPGALQLLRSSRFGEVLLVGDLGSRRELTFPIDSRGNLAAKATASRRVLRGDGVSALQHSSFSDSGYLQIHGAERIGDRLRAGVGHSIRGQRLMHYRIDAADGRSLGSIKVRELLFDPEGRLPPLHEIYNDHVAQAIWLAGRNADQLWRCSINAAAESSR